MEITAFVNNRTIVIRNGSTQVVECFPGESIKIGPNGMFALDTVTQTAGLTAEIDGLTVTPGGVGRAQFRVAAQYGGACTFELCCCEPACITRICGNIHSRGACASGRDDTPEHHRMILRSVCTHVDAFDGRVASLDGVALAQYGA